MIIAMSVVWVVWPASMDWTVFAVQWLHVLLGVFWFGAVLYNAFIFFPALTRLPLMHQREIGRAIGEQAFRVIRPVAIAVIVLGILRGTGFGPIQSVAEVTTSYGMTWLVALLFTIGAVIWAERVIAPALERLNAIPEAEAIGPDGQATPLLLTAIDGVRRRSALELGFFLVIFSCMILMRFAL